jgi:hypothetical protein
VFLRNPLQNYYNKLLKLVSISRKMQKSAFFFKGWCAMSTFLGIKSTFLGLNLKKSAFLVIWYSFGILSVVSRSSVGELRQGTREGKEMAILIKVLFYVWEFFGRSLVLL